MGVPAGMACGPSAAQAGSEPSRLADCSVVTCDVAWWACQDLNLGPHPYQQNAGNRCADDRSCRSRSTVEGEVMCSHRVQLSALIVRLDPAIAEHIRSPFTTAPHRHRRLPATMPCTMLPTASTSTLHSLFAVPSGFNRGSARAVRHSHGGPFPPSITSVGTQRRRAAISLSEPCRAASLKGHACSTSGPARPYHLAASASRATWSSSEELGIRISSSQPLCSKAAT
jgi:hypothetical protein